MSSAGDQRSSLAGRTILVTRAAEQSGTFRDRLQAQGATVVEMPALEIGPPSSWAALDGAIAQLDTFDWLILTSANGVRAFFERLQHDSSQVARQLQTLKIAVVGQKTAQSLRHQGHEPDFIPPNFVADSLVSHFPNREQLPQMRLLFPRVESGGRDILVKELTAQGTTVVEVPAYQSQCPTSIDDRALSTLQSGTVDAVTFASSKTVRCFDQLLRGAIADSSERQTVLSSLCIASIGPQTSLTCQELLGRVDAEATEYTLDGLIKALEQWLQQV